MQKFHNKWYFLIMFNTHYMKTKSEIFNFMFNIKYILFNNIICCDVKKVILKYNITNIEKNIKMKKIKDEYNMHRIVFSLLFLS